MLLLGLLTLSVVHTVGRGYRRVSQQLELQRLDAELAEERYSLLRDLDAALTPIAQAVDDGMTSTEVLATLATVLRALHPGLRWRLPGPGTVALAPVGVTIAPSGGVRLVPQDLAVLAQRAQHVVDAMWRRDHDQRARESERRRDGLTGLANRRGFNEAVERKLCDGSPQPVTVVLIDLDHFGDINGSIGFAGADRILLDVAQRLAALGRTVPGALVARIAADEFGLVLRPVGRPEAFAREVQRACTFLSGAGGVEAAVTVSVGLSSGSSLHVETEELQRQAAVAILIAKQSDRSGFVQFDPIRHADLASSLDDDLAIRTARDAKEFVMHYQPVVQLEDGAPLGCEALVRWDRPGVGLVGPGEFLSLIERSGSAFEFGVENLDTVLGTWSAGLRAAFAGCHGPGPFVSVNVDAVQLGHPGFEGSVLSALQRHRVEPRDLVLELTERQAVAHEHSGMLSRLRGAGVRIAIDDFGSGFSSLGQSTRLPLDLLKLDRTFVASLGGDVREQQLFRDVAQFALTLGLELIAEGIETEAVAATLRSAGIRHGQGFLYSRAVPADQLITWVRSRLGTAVAVPTR
jgi:diguanylate cyclase (GGDEF)-like protein